MNEEKFNSAREKVLGGQRKRENIGTLGEKAVHAVLKCYLEPDTTLHEVKVEGFVADICRGEEIIEIQTRSFDKLRKKLTAFLESYNVTLVYPIAAVKTLRWVDPDTGEVSRPRKSNKTGRPCDILPELYYIRELLGSERLRIMIILLQVDEVRLLDGWSSDRKKGATRADRTPEKIFEEIYINKLADYGQLIPGLDKEFTIKDFMKASGMRSRRASYAVKTLCTAGIAARTGKRGNAYIYTHV